MKLIHYDSACREIALATTLDEAKDWADKAQALKAYARQAHNTELEVQIAEIKVRALRRLGELSSQIEKLQGERADLQPLPSTGKKSKEEQLKDAGVSTSAANRAEQIAAIPQEDFETRLAQHRDEQIPVNQESIKKPHVSNNSGNNEWYTPPEIITSARIVMGDIDLDPASSEIANKTVKADVFYTKDDCGIEKEWSGRIWMNPPYAQPLISQFIEKYASSSIEEGIVLVNNATDTKWFQRLAEKSDYLCFINKRVRFLDPDGNPGAPLQGQAIAYTGKNGDAFMREFSKYGFVCAICQS